MKIQEMLPVIIPLAIVQLGLLIAALIHILKHNKYKMGNRVLWIVISCCLNIIGPVLYFVIGKGDDE